MKKLIITCCIFLIHNLIFGHPGIGIVKDSKGNIYYTDLKQVWKISTGGDKSVVVKNVHTHELYIDAKDNLFGEHLWYNGERLDTWGYYIWCLKSSGELVKEKEPTEGFVSNYSFVRDSSGNMYWVERFTISRFMKKTPEGKISKLAEGKFAFIGWLYCTANGTIYFTESNKLHKLTPDGKFTLHADNLKSKTTEFSISGRNYDGYGIWTDKADNIYIAMVNAKKINRISPDGKVEPVFFTNSAWTPCSGLFDNDGNLWLMEFSVTNETRVRKISPEKINNTIDAQQPFVRQVHFVATIITGVAIFLVWILLRVAINKQKQKLRLMAI